MIRILIFSFLLLLVSGCKKDKDVFAIGTPSDFLSDVNYKKLRVEFVYAAGMRPAASTLDNIRSFLTEHLKKPDGIEFTEKEIGSPGKSVFSIDDIRAIEQTHRNTEKDDKTITAWIFFADGDYAANGQGSKVLGVAYGVSSMAVFEKTIREFSGGLTQPAETTVETIVSNHEFGHILGLVNNGISMAEDHQDQAHGKHCNNSKCLMYYSTETSDLISNLLGNTIPELDNNCLNDLRKAGGK